MKKPKSHHFKYRDPEKVAPKVTNKMETERETTENEPWIKQDLRKTLIVITAFIGVIFVLYFVQSKTDLLKPVLKIFGL